jgi:osmotically-inducible protein OsmY
MTTTGHRSDADVKRAILAELEWTLSINSAHIGVAVNEGVVTLSGETDSYPERLLAEKAALRVRGVVAVAEEITVKSPWKLANDSDIALEASEAIQRAVDVPDSVNVAVKDYVVTLSGAVQWHHELVAAYRAVQYIKGIHEVVNHITILPSAEVTDIKSAITDAFVRSAQFEGNNIAVVSDENHGVTLEGSVGSWSEYRQAEQVAWSAPGITTVKNRLRIAP